MGSRPGLLKTVAAGSHSEKPRNSGESVLSLAGGTAGRLSVMARNCFEAVVAD
jgi:hypothetical protein